MGRRCLVTKAMHFSLYLLYLLHRKTFLLPPTVVLHRWEMAAVGCRRVWTKSVLLPEWWMLKLWRLV